MIDIVQAACQSFIFKIHSTRLSRSGWKLTLPIDEARRNDEVISLANSQVLRWVDELNGVRDLNRNVQEIKASISEVKKQPCSVSSKREIKRLYSLLDALQFKPDYMCLIIDREKDYYRACEGFSINGISYKRLLGTNGGIKNSTIVFISERLHDEIARRIDNGRKMDKPIVTAKLEAYKALTCSASIPVSNPRGVLIVKDTEVNIMDDILYLTDEGDGEPKIEEKLGEILPTSITDGCGMMTPALAKRWSKELGLDYIVSGANTRYAFEKGVVFAFDFIDFAEQVAGTYYVKDAWGHEVDIRNVELVLTTNMVKLWDSYSSCDDYLSKSEENGYSFSIAKVTPKELENERNINYQYIQPYELSDDDIEELIAPTMNEIKEVLGGDWRKTILFLKGTGLNERSVVNLPNDFAKAIMIDHRMVNDPFVKQSVYSLIKNRINEAKVGSLKVHGNYSIISGDLYALCQFMFGLEPTGLLRAGEIYNRYWKGTDKVVCYRSPMSCHNNIRLFRPSSDEEVCYWYQYMNTCTVFNGHDSSMAALNGCDFDGDIVMLTDNRVLVDNYKPLPVLVCAQRTAVKTVADEFDFIQSNIQSFGNEIGQTTNWITSMFEVQARYEKGSREYEELSYRIMAGQQYQQNAIDRAKGIVCKPMCKEWRDRHAVNRIEDDEQKSFYKSIVADKKPYFMRYIYPSLMKQYNTYIKNVNKNSLREFQLTVDEMISMNREDLDEAQVEFLKYYDTYMPVGVSGCVMNKICRRFEEEFDRYIGKHKQNSEFDYSILKNPDFAYSKKQMESVKAFYKDYNRRLSNYSIFSSFEKVDSTDSRIALADMGNEFLKDCLSVCPNQDVLCNILVDICYPKSATKRFAWHMCCDEIISNLLRANGFEISYPHHCESGELNYCGERFEIRTDVIPF